MTKGHIRTQLGLKIMNINVTLTANGCVNLLNKFFKGCKTISAMEYRIKLNKGYDNAAKILANYPTRVWKTKGHVNL